MNGAARTFLSAILCVLLVGFGLCGAWGTLVGLPGVVRGSGGGESFDGAFLVCGLIGLAIAGLCWMAIAWLERKRPPPSGE